MRRRTGGVIDLRIQSTFAPRSAAHVTLGLNLAIRRRRLRWVAVAGVAVASDLVLRSWLRRDTRWRLVGRLAWDAADAAFWGWHTRHEPSDSYPRQIMLGTVVPHAVEAGVRLAAGTQARPVLDGAVPLPLENVADGVRVAAKGLAVALGPSLVVRTIRRFHGDPRWPFIENVWPVGALVLSMPLARTRDRLQKRAVREWEARAEATIARQAGDLQLALASHASIGHDFPKVLQILGYFGSEEAMRAGSEGLARPASLAPDGRGQGRLLGQLVSRADLDPPEAALHWLEGPEVEAVRSFLDRPGAEASEGPVRLTRSGNGSSVLRVGEEELILRPPLAGVKGNFDPIEGVIFVSGFWKMVTLLPDLGGRRGNRGIPILAAALDVWATVEHRRSSSDGISPNRRSLALSTISLVLMAAREAGDGLPRWTSTGAPLVVTTMSACGTLGLIGTWWDDLDEDRWAWVGLALAAFVAGATRAGRRRDPVVAWELVPLWQVFGSVRGLTRVMVSEREVLAAHLSERYRARVAEEGLRYLEGELAAYRRLLAIARRAIGEQRASTPEAVLREVEDRCDELERWLDAPETGAELVPSPLARWGFHRRSSKRNRSRRRSAAVRCRWSSAASAARDRGSAGTHGREALDDPHGIEVVGVGREIQERREATADRPTDRFGYSGGPPRVTTQVDLTDESPGLAVRLTRLGAEEASGGDGFDQPRPRTDPGDAPIVLVGGSARQAVVAGQHRSGVGEEWSRVVQRFDAWHLGHQEPDLRTVRPGSVHDHAGAGRGTIEQLDDVEQADAGKVWIGSAFSRVAVDVDEHDVGGHERGPVAERGVVRVEAKDVGDPATVERGGKRRAVGREVVDHCRSADPRGIEC